MNKYQEMAAIEFLTDWQMESLYCTTPSEFVKMVGDNEFFIRRVIAIKTREHIRRIKDNDITRAIKKVLRVHN